MRILTGMKYLFLWGLLAGMAMAPSGDRIRTRFTPPAGAERVDLPEHSFGAYLRELPLFPAGTAVHTYDGGLKYRQDVHAAVIDISVGDRDLQQCADAVMRLRAEHLFAEQRYPEIAFNFTSGFRADFVRWSRGERIKVNGTTCTWVKTGGPDASHAALLTYLDKVFTYAGTLSLSRELRSARHLPMEVGDVFIQGGSPGHAVIVVDLARTADGRNAFLLAQSYMPAQQIHVLKNLEHPELGAWFIEGADEHLLTPEWTFDWGDRKRW